MTLRFITPLAIVALLAGCSIPTAPVAVSMGDHSAGSSTAAIIPTGKQVSVGVLYSATTDTNRAYLRHYQANAGTGFGQSLLVQSIHDAYVATSNPDLAVDRVTTSLQRYFGAVTVYPDMPSLKAAKPDVMVVVDARSQLMTSRSSDIESTVSTLFYDHHFNYIATATGHAAKTLPPIWAGNKRSEEMVTEITEQQQVQLMALYRAVAGVHGAINTASPFSCHTYCANRPAPRRL